jgi:CheY-like chemotaxis protein
MAANQPKVMVVDDDPEMRLTLEGIIEDEGFDVRSASDGLQAIRMAEECTFDLIFMDIKMPGINGVDAYREIKKASPTSVVVMMTGFSLGELIKEALEEGVYAVLYKPFDVPQIIDIVRGVLKTTVVLLVDDGAADRATLRALLEDDGYRVSEAADGADAVRMAAEKHPGVILMDVKMPGLDGFAALQRIRSLDPQVKVIFISGYAIESAVKESLREGAYTALTKPVDPAEFLALMRSIMGQEDGA